MTGAEPSVSSTPKQHGFLELALFTAAVMALNALAIDMMLPALGIISDELNAARDNDRQLIVTVYVIAMGVAQLVFGPIVDRYGRRRVLLWSLGFYCIACFLSLIASSFTLLLATRAFQGVATAASRVAIIASVRDQVSGRSMAALMSLAITIFMAAPIVAPGIGQLVLMVGPWRWIFAALLIYAALISLWAMSRMPETLPPDKRRKMKPRRILAAYGEFLTNRIAIGYTMVSALCFGSLFGLISSSEQIFLETFAIGDYFALAFAAIAAALACATLLNARLVGRHGMRRICHGAVLGFVAINLVHLAITLIIGDNIAVFLTFTSLSFFCIGLIGPNCSALAMEPMGHIAGAAAAANGFAGTTLAGLFGALIGRLYNGATVPIVSGFMTLGVLALLMVIFVERGKLFTTGPAHD